jgi:hypothetical protein
VALVTGWLYRSAARPFFSMPAQRDPAVEREMRKYLAPLVAGMVFYALHGQIQVLLISLFGSSKSLAEVTALGRLVDSGSDRAQEAQFQTRGTRLAQSKLAEVGLS